MSPLPKLCPKCGTRYEQAAGYCARDGSALSADTEQDAYVGRVLLDQFEIQERIGAGGMGTVYRARQRTVERDVAIKILHHELVQNPEAVRRFQREAKVAAALDHPNVVRVFLFGQLPDGSLYLVMEHLRGRQLVDEIEQAGAMPLPRALHIATQIADGVGEAHAHGVVHRDVKPENVLLVQKGRDADFVKVLDFGIARFLWGDQTIATQSGLIFGTARYISPEGAAGEQTDARSDVYSLGVLAYQLLSGVTPFDSPSPVALLMKHVHDEAPSLLARTRGAVPKAICDVVMRSLSKNPDMRHDDANAFSEALREAAAEAGVPPVRAKRATGEGAWDEREPTGRVEQAGREPTGRVAHQAVGREPTGRVGREPTGRTEPAGREPTGRTRDGSRSVRVGSVREQPLERYEEEQAYPADRDDAPISDVAGLSPRRRNPWVLGLLAFVLGASAVGVGAVAARSLFGGGGTDVAQLEAQAHDAFLHEHYDTPTGENVAELTERILRADPDNADAKRMRLASGERLRAQADHARDQGQRDAARDLYRRALVLAPDDTAARDAMAALDTPAPSTSPAQVRVAPAAPQQGDSVTLFAELGAEHAQASESPRFEVRRGGRVMQSVPATQAATDSDWIAAFKFNRVGEHEVIFRTDGGLEVRATVQVAAPRRRVEGEPPVTELQVEPTHPVVVNPPPPGDGIDWTVRPAPQPANNPGGGTQEQPLPPTPPQPPTPPAPWTGT